MTDEEFQKYIFDRFKQPNGTFKNKLGITDAKELAKKEYDIVANRAQNLLSTDFQPRSMKDVIQIHKYLFDPIYEWAGEPRDTTINGKIPYNLSKAGHGFLPSASFQYATGFLNDLFRQCNQQNKIKPIDYARLLNNLNDWHGFREGNGRSTKVVMQCLAQSHGQTLNFDRHQKKLIQLFDEGSNEKINQEIANQLKITDLDPNKHLRHVKSHHSNNLEL